MTGKVVNLRQARKRRARETARAKADANAVKHGTPAELRALHRVCADQSAARHEGHRREGGDPEPGDGET
mgnify:FL=1